MCIVEGVRLSLILQSHSYLFLRSGYQMTLRSALFVDFDNVYLGLKKIDEKAAKEFAENPARWLAWLEQAATGSDEARRILVRRCYLNPRAFYWSRPYFTQAAFKVTDCPPLTKQSKNGTDIYMVMDILDVLEQLPHIDEFIIFSADADFTPVLLRLRGRDKQTTLLPIGPASGAFKAACDYLFTEEEFIEEALGIRPEVRLKTRADGGASESVLRRMADRVFATASAAGEIAAIDLPRVFKSFPEFVSQSNWLGYFSLRALTEAVVRQRTDLTITDTEPWSVVTTETEGGDQSEPLRDRIVEVVRTLVADSASPISMASAAHEVQGQLGKAVLATSWGGAGSFKAVLERASDPRVAYVTAPGSPGYVFDPARHEAPNVDVDRPRDALADLPDDFEAFVQRISRVAQVPPLHPDTYALVFELVSEFAEEHPYHLTAASRYVRDRLVEEGESVGRAIVSFVLKGIYYGGHEFGEDDRPELLAEAYLQNVRTVLEGAQVDLNEDEEALLEAWLLEGIAYDESEEDDESEGYDKDEEDDEDEELDEMETSPEEDAETYDEEDD